MDRSNGGITSNISTPKFIKEANLLASKMALYNKEEIKKLFKVSDTIAESTHQRYNDFISSPAAPAITSYTGSVFKMINPIDFSKEDMLFADDNLVIISVLYGLLRPLDGIKTYRLEYKTKVKDIDNSLYNFWKPHLTMALAERLKASNNTLINLASLDILPALEMDKLDKEFSIITPEFKLHKDGVYKNVQTYSKMARGAMSRYIIKNRIEQPEQLKNFDWNGYTFNQELSTSNNYIFTKE